jgi:hypothetical protein
VLGDCKARLHPRAQFLVIEGYREVDVNVDDESNIDDAVSEKKDVVADAPERDLEWRYCTVAVKRIKLASIISNFCIIGECG